MFMIEPNDPLRPMLVGKPVDTLGEFPVSLAYSSSLSMCTYGLFLPFWVVYTNAYWLQYASLMEEPWVELPASMSTPALA